MTRTLTLSPTMLDELTFLEVDTVDVEAPSPNCANGKHALVGALKRDGRKVTLTPQAVEYLKSNALLNACDIWADTLEATSDRNKRVRLRRLIREGSALLKSL